MGGPLATRTVSRKRLKLSRAVTSNLHSHSKYFLVKEFILLTRLLRKMRNIREQEGSTRTLEAWAIGANLSEI